MRIANKILTALLIAWSAAFLFPATSVVAASPAPTYLAVNPYSNYVSVPKNPIGNSGYVNSYTKTNSNTNSNTSNRYNSYYSSYSSTSKVPASSYSLNQYRIGVTSTIVVGVYMKEKDRFPQSYKVKLNRDKRYVVEARCRIMDFAKIGKRVTFRVSSNNGLEYFEMNNVPVGKEISIPWEYDAITQTCSAKITMTSATMTAIFKTDHVLATSEGVKEGKLEFEILPPK